MKVLTPVVALWAGVPRGAETGAVSGQAGGAVFTQTQKGTVLPEVTSLTGLLTTKNEVPSKQDKPFNHLHIITDNQDYSLYLSHFNEIHKDQTADMYDYKTSFRLLIPV